MPSASFEVDPAGRDHGARASRRVALDVHRHGIHGDVGGADLHVNAERRRVPAPALAGSIPSWLHHGFDNRPRSWRFPDRWTWCRAGASPRPWRRACRRSEVPPTPTPTMVGGHTRPPQSMTRSMTKRLIAFTPSAGISICRNEPFSEPELLRDHLDLDGLVAPVEIDVDDWHADAARGLFVLAGERMHDGGAQRMLGGGALAAAADGGLHRRAFELDVPADDDVVNRNAGILAEQVLAASRRC